MTSFSRSDLSTFFDKPSASPLCRRSQKPCEAASKGDQVGKDISVQCTGAVKAGDLLLKKTGDYLLKSPPALHYHCAKRLFDNEVRATLLYVITRSRFRDLRPLPSAFSTISSSLLPVY